MRSTGKQPIKPIKPSPATSPAIMLIDADPPEGDQERDEEDVSDTRNYQAGTKAFREVADEERDTHEPAPVEAAHADADEARELDQVDVKDEKQNRKPAPKPQIKKERPSKEK